MPLIRRKPSYFSKLSCVNLTTYGISTQFTLQFQSVYVLLVYILLLLLLQSLHNTSAAAAVATTTNTTTTSRLHAAVQIGTVVKIRLHADKTRSGSDWYSSEDSVTRSDTRSIPDLHSSEDSVSHSETRSSTDWYISEERSFLQLL